MQNSITIILPVGLYPNCLQATCASALVQKSSHTVAHSLFQQISTRPWKLVLPPNQPDCTIGASYVNKTQNVINMHGLQFGLLIPGHILLAVIHTGNSTLEYALYFRSTIYKNTIIILRCMHHIYSVYYYIYYLSQTN